MWALVVSILSQLVSFCSLLLAIIMNLFSLNFLMYFHLFSIIVCEYFDSRCTEEFCEKEIESGKCIASNAYCRKNPSSIRFLHPDTCNCCEYCLKKLKKVDVCAVGQPGAVSPLEICGPGLQCISNAAGNNATCERMMSDCTRAQDSYDERLKGGDVGMTEVRPQCDADGFFKPYHCIPGSICYCRAPTGERIFGELPYLQYEDEEKMICGCSINAWKAQYSLDPSHRITVARCTEIGTFDELQCMMGENAACLCVNPKTGAPITNIDTVLEEDIKENNPVCFDPSRHSPGKYSTDCETEYDFYSRSIEADEDKNTEMKEPFCQPDGKFSRVQLAGSKKICVDPGGRQIDVYEAEIGELEEKNMNCNCAKTRWLLESVGVVELPSCCSNGNFQAWQCRRNECFCVDNNGNQQGMEVNIKDVSKLKCYNGGEPCYKDTATS